jgi:hypothetical protein
MPTYIVDALKNEAEDTRPLLAKDSQHEIQCVHNDGPTCEGSEAPEAASRRISIPVARELRTVD